jgi:proteasome lid subunit RPN8/RPN11
VDGIDRALILRLAAKYPTIEVCGYVWEDGRTLPMKNIAKHPDKYFMMDLNEQKMMVERYGMPSGVWHSHPNGDPEPSDIDTLFHAEAGLRMLIVANGVIHDYGVPGPEAAARVLED